MHFNTKNTLKSNLQSHSQTGKNIKILVLLLHVQSHGNCIFLRKLDHGLLCDGR